MVIQGNLHEVFRPPRTNFPLSRRPPSQAEIARARMRFASRFPYVEDSLYEMRRQEYTVYELRLLVFPSAEHLKYLCSLPSTKRLRKIFKGELGFEFLKLPEDASERERLMIAGFWNIWFEYGSDAAARIKRDFGDLMEVKYLAWDARVHNNEASFRKALECIENMLTTTPNMPATERLALLDKRYGLYSFVLHELGIGYMPHSAELSTMAEYSLKAAYNLMEIGKVQFELGRFARSHSAYETALRNIESAEKFDAYSNNLRSECEAGSQRAVAAVEELLADPKLELSKRIAALEEQKGIYWNLVEFSSNDANAKQTYWSKHIDTEVLLADAYRDAGDVEKAETAYESAISSYHFFADNVATGHLSQGREIVRRIMYCEQQLDMLSASN